MTSLVLTLAPEKLENPDLDLRYIVPDLLAAQSGGNIANDGYDYEDRECQASPLMAIFLTAQNLPAAMATISQLVCTQCVLGNKLSRGTLLYKEKDGVRSPIPFIGHATDTSE